MMAPMLGRKLFSLSKPLTEPLFPGEKIYTIEHTKERFRSKEKYETRLSIYQQRIWTCKSTGSSQLTHKEAWDLEQTISEHLLAKFPSWFEKPVLQIIHHSTLALEKLVEQSYLEIMTKYAVGEECDFKCDDGKYMRVKILRSYPAKETDLNCLEKNIASSWDSTFKGKVKSGLMVPDHDIKDSLVKEKSNSIEILRKRLGFKALPPLSLRKEKQWFPHKYHLYKYKVKAQNESKIIRCVPAERLRRSKYPPSTVTLRYFIRHHALKTGLDVNALWVVDDELVKKYALHSKFKDFIQEPYKYMTLHYSPNISTNKVNKCISPDKNVPFKTENGEKHIKDRSQKMSQNRQILYGKPNSTKVDLKNPIVEKSTQVEITNHSPKMPKNPKTIALYVKPYNKLQKDVSPIALQLTAYYTVNKNREDQKDSLSCLITEAVRLLTNDDCATLPEDLQILVKKRQEKLERMTAIQYKQYLRETRSVLKEKMKEKAKQRREKVILKKLEEQQLFLDEHLSGTSLPTFNPVDIPGGLPNMLFGEVVKVVELLNCYAGILMPYGKFLINAISLIEALTAGKNGFLYLNLVLMALLHTLLNDKTSQDYGELGMKVSEIPVSLHSVSELVRLCLHNAKGEESCKDSYQEDNASESNNSFSFNNKVKDETLLKLETFEFFELPVEEKLCILSTLCHIVHTHLEALQQRSVKTEQQVLLDAEDMITGVKRQQQIARETNMKNEMQDGQLEATLIKKLKEAGVQKQSSELDKALNEGFAKAKLQLNRSPIGIDRNDNMYWLFSDAIPGLFIKKQTISASKEYICSLQLKELKKQCNSELKDNFVMGGMASTSDIAASSVTTKRTVCEKGKSLWCFCDSQKTLDELMNCLYPKGVRESELKQCLKKRYQDIVHSMNLAHEQKPELRQFDGQQELLNFLHICIIELAMRLHESRLGRPDKSTKFKARVNSLHRLKDFGECVILLQASVRKKFLQGFMAPKHKNSLSDHADDQTEEANVDTTLLKWKCAVRNAQTFSRMHFLLGMLDACIKWDMSSQKVRCKVCSKKIEDDQLILCDQCSEAFHLFCLIPALCEIPDGEWQCPACRPSTPRFNVKGMNYAHDFTEVESANDKNPSDEDFEEGDFYFSELDEQQLSPQTASKTKHKRVGSRPERQDQPPFKKSKMVASELKRCEEILNKLINYRFSWPFREPITLEGSEDRTKTDSTPMDFITMLSKCTCNMYNSTQEFLEDIKLIFNNAELCNRRGAYVTTCLHKTENFLVAMLKEQLPSYAYQRSKLSKRPTKRATPRTDKEGEDVNDPKMVIHCI